MSCREEIRPWTFATLVGAFADLAVAYLLLCAAGVAYLAERFLAFFGFELPCPCVSAGDPTCLRGLLANGPVSRIASVRKSVWNRSPFDSVWAVDGGNRGNAQGLIGPGGNSKVGLLEGARRGGEGSCGSILLIRDSKREVASDEPSSSTSVGGRARLREVGSMSEEEPGDADARGAKRGTLASKPLRLGIRRRRREAERRKRSPNLGYGTPLLGWKESRRSESPCSNTEISDRDFSNGNATPMPSKSDIPPLGTNEEFSGSNSIRLADRSVSDAGLRWACIKCKGVETVSVDALESKEAEIIRNLELALREAQASRSALYRELEKERSASASAADEAMAMIERLQKEKASIEMNARQYQRMIEEKTTYDEEEMDILKEIVVRRERELYMLEKEVEMYREMMSGKCHGEALDGKNEIGDTSELVHPPTFDLEDDPTFMLRQLSHSINEREKVNYNGVDKTTEQVTAQKRTLVSCHVEKLSKGLFEEFNLQTPVGQSSGVNAKMLTLNDGYCLDFQEKGIVSVDPYASSGGVPSTGLNVACSKKLDTPEESGFPENRVSAVDENRGNYDREFSFDRQNMEIERNEGDKENDTQHNFSRFETESSTLDVHVVDDKIAICQEREEKGNTSQTDTASVNSQDFHSSEPYGFKNIDISSDYSSCAGGELNVRRSRSDMERVRRSLDGSLSRAASPMDMRRHSASTVETERSKLEFEIEDLRRRLRLIQQGRQKLNFSVERVEKEKFQLQLLEEIALQLKEIREQAGLGSATRQGSLPPPSSKANSKKKRCRSASLGIQGSS